MQKNSLSSLWIQGTTRTGKTSCLVKEFSKWIRHQLIQKHSEIHPQDKLTSAVLVLAANNNNQEIYQKGISLNKKAQAEIEMRLRRNPSLPKWDILIRPH